MNSRRLERILIVEDEPDILEIAKMALETLGGFRVLGCASGPEALERAPRFKPDLVLLDVMMPEMDGPTTLAHLSRLPEMAQVPAVFLSAKIQKGEVEQYKKFGAKDVIDKPFDPLTLPQRVRDIWEREDRGEQP